jgi:[acyl-carrier-protein] S-malonyltransferase
MQNVLAMFPGQGSQYLGMGRQACDQFQVAREVFEEADQTLGFPISQLCFHGPEDQLKPTFNQQPAILTTSIAIWKVLRQELGDVHFRPALFAGHSLGEYSALVASGKLEFTDALRLVRLRGMAMQKAVPEGQGAMAAVMGCNPDDLQKKCKNLRKTLGIVEVVNFNSPQQQIISGRKEAVLAMVEQLKLEKIRCALLPVSAPFHSSLMEPARIEMQTVLAQTKLRDSDRQVIANLTGKMSHPYSIENLIQQIDQPVLWTKTLDTAVASGISIFVEIGPGSVLAGLARRSVPKDAKILATDDLSKALVDLSSILMV